MRRLLWQAIWFYRRKLAGARSINGLVIDVGSGNSPYPRADVLAERYLADDSNRIQGQAVLLAAPAVACDAEALPFADATFAYAVCSHLIEHVDHPDRVLDELSRVAGAGYLECPDEAYDKLDTPAYHRWFATLEDGVLVLRQKESATFDPEVKTLVHETFYPDSGFWTVFWRHLDRFFVMLEWEGAIPYRVEYLPLADGRPGSAEESTFDDSDWVEAKGFNVAEESPQLVAGVAGAGLVRRAKHLFWKLLRAVARPRRGEVDVLSLLVCPADRGGLDRVADGLRCEVCNEVYPIRDGIPYMYIRRSGSAAND